MASIRTKSGSHPLVRTLITEVLFKELLIHTTVASWTLHFLEVCKFLRSIIFNILWLYPFLK